MSGTTIATSKVIAVLLADGWHRIIQGSFSVAALRFGAEADPGVLGFCCEEVDTGSPYRPAALAGPLNSVLASGRSLCPPDPRAGPLGRQSLGRLSP
jgi:hypothetical protein